MKDSSEVESTRFENYHSKLTQPRLDLLKTITFKRLAMLFFGDDRY